MIIDILVLIIVLALSGFSLYRKRSRGSVWALSIFSLIYFGFIRKGCVCAVGTVQNITDSFVNGTVPAGAVVVLFLIPLITALFAGRLFCGTACPLGAVQDFISLDRFKVPKLLDRILVLLPPVVLYFVVVAVVRGDGYLLCRFDPYVSIFRMNAPFYLLIITAAAVIVTLLIARPFCRYLCPYGVLLGVASLFSKWRVEIEPENSCRDCTLCRPACPVNVILESTVKDKSRPKQWIVPTGVFLIVTGAIWFGGELAVLPRLFFEKESLELTPELLSRLAVAGRIMGAVTSLFWSLELAALLKPVQGYAPLVHRCISCARCYNHCPGEIKRVRKMGVSK